MSRRPGRTWLQERLSVEHAVAYRSRITRHPKLLDQRTARRLLEERGWEMTRGGKHVVKMEKAGERPITLPRHGGKTYGKGLTAAILRQADLH